MTDPKVAYRAAKDLDEWLKALALVSRIYKKKGLSSDKELLRITQHHLTPFSNVFVAVNDADAVIATISAVEDSPHGLPMESVYCNEISQKRLQGKRLMEVICLAVSEEYANVNMKLVLGLLTIVTVYALEKQQDEIIIAVHPRHGKLYKRLFNFQEFGGLKHYPAVENALAVALFLDLKGLFNLEPKFYDILTNGIEMYRGKLKRNLSEQDVKVLRFLVQLLGKENG